VSRVRLAALGGTFDHLHIGHHVLLACAFRVGTEVAVGVTTDRFVSDQPKPLPGRIQPYRIRRAAVVRWLRRNYPRRTWRVTALGNPYGRSVDPEVGVLVVSSDTERGGRAVNRERRRRGRLPVSLVVVPLVLADDLEPVSSRRVRAHEISPDGRRLAPIRVLVRCDDRVARGAAVRAVRRVFPRARVPRHPRPGAPYDIALRLDRRGTSRWTAAEYSPHVRLRPRRLAASRPADLERELVTLLRPRQ
jgi:pantetheine-phosphate adenylyltransferase